MPAQEWIPTCSRCRGPREGKHRYCRDCRNAYSRATRPKHTELSPEERQKANARAYLNVYIRRGKIVRMPCHVCGSPKAEGHHHDYSKPLDVVWLCRPCHMAEHGK